MEKETLVETYKDMQLTVKYEFSPTWTDFEAFQIIYTDDNGTHGYERKGATSSGDEVENISEAQPYIRGVVKWDGCSHYYFGDEEGYLHLCGKYDIKHITEAIRKIYERSGELMTSRDETEFNCKANHNK